jgi:hypothetical protein
MNFHKLKHLIVALFLCHVSYGQEVYQGVFKPYNSLELGSGSANYIGDLVPWKAFPTMGPKTAGFNVRVGLNRYYTQKFSGKLSYQLSQLTADDNKYIANGKFGGNFIRNLHFQNYVHELSAQGAYHFQRNRSNILKRQRIRTQVQGGLSLIFHTPFARPMVSLASNTPQRKNWQNLAAVNTEGTDYARFIAAIPLGFSLQIKLSDQIDLGLSSTVHVTFSDYLDDVSDDRSNISITPQGIFFDRSLEPFGANTLRNRIPILPNANGSFSKKGNDLFISTQIQLVYHLRRGNTFNQLNN